MDTILIVYLVKLPYPFYWSFLQFEWVKMWGSPRTTPTLIQLWAAKSSWVESRTWQGTAAASCRFLLPGPAPGQGRDKQGAGTGKRNLYATTDVPCATASCDQQQKWHKSSSGALLCPDQLGAVAGCSTPAPPPQELQPYLTMIPPQFEGSIPHSLVNS